MPSPRALAFTGCLFLALSLTPLVLAHPVIAAWSIVLPLLLLFIVAVHEFGHAVVARACGMCVSELRIGIGPRLARLNLAGLPIRLGVVPLGGQARITGMTPESAGGAPGTYAHAPLWARTLVALGGILANLLSAWVALMILAWWRGAGWESPARASAVFSWLMGLMVDAVCATVQAGPAFLTQARSVLVIPAVASQATGVAPPAQLALILFVLLSLVIAVVNLAPLAPLDGFLLVIIGVDALRRVRDRGAPPLAAAAYRWVAWGTALPLLAVSIWVYGRDVVALFASVR